MSTHSDIAVHHAIILSDHVIREEGTGKLSFIGVFDNYTLPKFPFLTPPLVITPMLTNVDEKEGEMRLTVRIEDPETGHVLVSASTRVQFQHHTRGTLFAIPVSTPPFAFPKPGNFKIVVLANNENVGARELIVQGITKPQTIKSEPEEEQ
ncbi:MAG: hypothetical protein H7A45_10370 [Verrucomicrobiales bacterium]|nr:hypothetical protein [Verrucomicrobiales bacterium]MCP5528227.1 hypothetical protein [Verrucomicrobiales bacterium]